jgi:hypothetical protein
LEALELLERWEPSEPWSREVSSSPTELEPHEYARAGRSPSLAGAVRCWSIATPASSARRRWCARRWSRWGGRCPTHTNESWKSGPSRRQRMASSRPSGHWRPSVRRRTPPDRARHSRRGRRHRRSGARSALFVTGATRRGCDRLGGIVTGPRQQARLKGRARSSSSECAPLARTHKRRVCERAPTTRFVRPSR